MVDHDLILERLRHDAHATLGRLYLGGLFLCFTLENRPPRIPGVKEPGRSRIPAGRYPLTLRRVGNFHSDYQDRFPWHEAMVEIELPGWDAVLFHIGNYHRDTAGCVLVGERAGKDVEGDSALTVWGSAAAYEDVYPALYKHAKAGGFITVQDEKETGHA